MRLDQEANMHISHLKLLRCNFVVQLTVSLAQKDAMIQPVQLHQAAALLLTLLPALVARLLVQS